MNQIAQQLKEKNIAEYLIYMWQEEDLIRANHCEPEEMEANVIARYPEEQRPAMREWYTNLITMMGEEGVREKGHLQINKNVIINLTELHNALSSSPKFPFYSAAYFKALPFIVELRNKNGKKDEPELETCFEALYGVLLLRLQKKSISEGTDSKKDFLKKRNLFSGEEQILTDDIEEKVTSSITTHYKSISKVKESFESQIDELAEMFSLDRRILNEVGYKAGDSDQSILKKVYEYNADISAKHDAGIKSVMDSLKELTPSSKDFKKKLNEKVKKVTELVPQINRTELVRYISKRKVILDLMQKTLDKQLDCQQKNSKGKKINHESFLHNILFSQHSDDPLDSNLWMINDDFIHYKGISESELRNIKVENELFFREDLTKEELEELTAYNRDKLGNRPDILLFPKEHKCIIIELKSMDADVSKFVSQVSQYAGLIRQYAKDRFEITTFYAYLIGESFTLNEVKRANPFFKKAYYFDYLFCPNYPVDGGENRRDGEMYIEVIKYSTLLERAVFRNKIFTNKI